MRIGPAPMHPMQTDTRTSPNRTLKVFGGLQICLGIVCSILGTIGAVLSNTTMQDDCNYDYYYYMYGGYFYPYYTNCNDSSEATAIFIMDLICMAFSGWFILTGCFPFCMTEKRVSSWKCLKITFLVCNIFSATIFSSTVFSLGILGTIFSESANNDAVLAISAVLSVFSFVQFALSIAAASYSCCCGQLSTNDRQGFVMVNPSQPGMMYNMPNTQIMNGYQGNNQMWIPPVPGYQQPIMPNIHQQIGQQQGNNQPSVQGMHQQPIAGYFIAVNQQQPWAYPGVHAPNLQEPQPENPIIERNQENQ
ncbi:uncharacterized protein [Mytilus edulis]|uniref:uncharacterized protein n=1 Tax=Mytilus edulis TaxID=6550 RepID=UPI0039EEDC25